MEGFGILIASVENFRAVVETTIRLILDLEDQFSVNAHFSV